ncbi:efflux RND transporter periplasmic adaptor subunit [Paraburkholderia elongata]|uniref:Biotin/lipoyl-binding protein n=1 Tax=Paraburkholderia elongata TaxID=2675747 RepID=A0A972NZT9_9BURK|nr:biotin/lipoyl-binding protein [Paraburkholderia elongata]NPT60590.1 biotin/lipoyl-binding protein [Paraburkholderia elongata]
MKTTRKRIIFAAVVAVVILAIAIGHAIKKRSGAVAAGVEAPSSVVEFAPDDLTTVSRRTLSETLPLTGSLRAVTQAAVKSKVVGSALNVMVREGDPVKTGQILAKIDARDYVARAEQTRGQMAAMAGQLDIAKQIARQQPRAGRKVFGTGTISVGSRQDVLVVPATAIRTDGTRHRASWSSNR